MPFVLLAILIGVPLLELVVMIKVGGAIGVLPTIALLIGMGLLGTLLLRSQGRRALRQASEALSSGRPPVDSVIDAIALLLAGALMLTPGFLTDFLALFLLIPPVRQRLGRWLFARAASRALFDVKIFRSGSEPRPGPIPPGGTRNAADSTVIEGEFTRLDDEDGPNDGRANN